MGDRELINLKQTLQSNVPQIKQGLLIAALVILVGVIVYLLVQKSKLIDTIIKQSHELAIRDSLEFLWSDSVNIFMGKYGEAVKDRDALTDENTTIKKFAKSQQAQIDFLASVNSALVVDNIALHGQLKNDSIGEYARFDTASPFYKMAFEARLHPTLLKINGLEFPDSSYIGKLILKDGLVKGFISHTNPFIREKSAMFYYPYETPAVSTSVVNKFEWGFGGVAVAGIATGQGKALLGGVISMAVAEGIKAIIK